MTRLQQQRQERQQQLQELIGRPLLRAAYARVLLVRLFASFCLLLYLFTTAGPVSSFAMGILVAIFGGLLCMAGIYFTCFIGTKVQVLTLQAPPQGW